MVCRDYAIVYCSHDVFTVIIWLCELYVLLVAGWDVSPSDDQVFYSDSYLLFPIRSYTLKSFL